MGTLKKLFILIFVVSLSACNTVAGIGEDIAGGATWTKEKISGK